MLDHERARFSDPDITLGEITTPAPAVMVLPPPENEDESGGTPPPPPPPPHPGR